MKAIVLEAYGDASHLKLKTVETPQPQKGEVRVRIKAVGFNPVDCKIRQGMYGGNLPIILGVDCSGVIDAIGSDVSGFTVGEEVIAFAFGQCSNGSYAEFVCLPIQFVVKKPKNITFEQAASIPVAALTAYRAVFSTGAVKKGETIFIAGAGGGVGAFAIPFAQYLGVKKIFTVAGSEASAQFLHQELKINRDHILIYRDLTTEQLEKKLIAMNGEQLFNATFDFVGKEMKQLCLKLTAHSGHFVTPVPENEPFDFPVWERGKSLPFNRNMSLHFIFIGSESFSGSPESWSNYAKHLQFICDLIAKGSIHLPPIKILEGFSLENIREAHRLLEEGRMKGKLVMKC